MPRCIPCSPSPVGVALVAALALCACGSTPKGKRWINALTLRGPKAVDVSQLREGLETQQTCWCWWLPTFKKQWFDASALDRDLERVERFYAERGFFRAQVVDTRVTPSDDGKSVNVEVSIDEGKASKVTAVTVTGLDDLAPTTRDKVLRALPLKKGPRFDHNTYRRSVDQVQQRLEDAGYAYADVKGEVKVDRDQCSAEARLHGSPGPLVRWGQTHLKGNGPIPADKILALTTYARGEVYDATELTRTRARLYKQRVFSSVNVRIPKDPTEVADVNIDLSVGKLRELSLGGGLGVENRRQEIRLKAIWTWRNFLGGLRTLRAELRPAIAAIPTFWDSNGSIGPILQSDLTLTQPDLFGSTITAFGGVGYDIALEDGYRYHGPRTQIGAERGFWDELLRVGLSWNLEMQQVFDIEEGSQGAAFLAFLGVGEDGSSVRPAWLEPFVRVDLRDDRLDPRAGLYTEVRLELGLPALGSLHTYFKIVPELRGYVPLFTKRFVLALRALVGYLMPAGDEISPFRRRIKLGGPTNHRGFGAGRLSPQFQSRENHWSPIGGDGALLLSADLRLRVIRLMGYWLGVNAFADAGDVTPNFSQLALDDLHLAVGGGLSYSTPVGALSFNVGVRLNRLDDVRDPNEPDLRLNPDPGKRIMFHILIGASF